MIIAISAAAMFTDRIPYLLGLFIFTAAVMLAGNVGIKRIWKQLTGAIGIVAFLFLLQTVFGQMELGAMLSLRLLIIIMSALILLTGPPRDYLLAMVQCRLPYELAYMVILAFHFFPILREESQDVYYSIQLRDRDYETWGSFMKKAYDDNKDAAFMIMAGDMVEKGSDPEDWKCFFTNGEYLFSRLPLMTTPGNHETSKILDTYLKMMSLPKNGPVSEEFYSSDYGDCHFASLNSCFLMPERQIEKDYKNKLKKVNEWLEKDLGNSNAKWKIVYMHHPMYPAVDDNELYGKLRSNWEKTFEAAGVDAVLCGHQHAYMRTKKMNGITYITSNSGEKRSYYIKGDTKLPDYVQKLYEEDSNYVRADVTGNEIKIESYNK